MLLDENKLVSQARIHVRTANITDIDWLLSELKEFSKFYDSRIELFGDPEHARRGLIDLMANHLLLIADKAHTRMGFIAGLIVPHLFNPKIKVLAETFWWVPEAHRGSRAGLMLLDSFVAYGNKHANWITFSLESKSPVDLTKRGFKFQEKSYLMEVL